MLLYLFVKIRFISQLISDISRVLENYQCILNGTAISTFTVLVLPVLFVNLDLSLNDSKSDMPSSTGASLQYWHKLCDVFE